MASSSGTTHSISTSTPVASTSGVRSDSLPSSPSHTSSGLFTQLGSRTQTTSPSPSLNFIQEDVKYLKALNFTVSLSTPFPKINGLFPNLSDYIKNRQKTLKASFILIPEYESNSALHSCYCSEEEIGIENYVQIHSTSPQHIIKTNARLKGKEGMVRGCYNAWVSYTLHLLNL